ncbi:hypothetical protein [Klebsiella quasipneumoniae]|uniref:hypothetical protein n=1 Tax=Klebsiella quasipneumoniae TaxID=1463165 RepID=UPI001C842F63|nr:hypothetical protein [Klebsiella quasipneumoniae]
MSATRQHNGTAPDNRPVTLRLRGLTDDQNGSPDKASAAIRGAPSGAYTGC